MSGYQQPNEIHSGTLTGTAAALGTIQTAKYNKLVIITTSTAETISVTGSPDTVAFTGKVRPIDLTTGALAASSDLASGSYVFDISGFKSVTFTKSAAANSGTVVYSVSRYT